MSNPLIRVIRGFPGKPSHPPLTDASIGAYTAGVAMLVAGAIGFQEAEMAHGPCSQSRSDFCSPSPQRSPGSSTGSRSTAARRRGRLPPSTWS